MKKRLTTVLSVLLTLVLCMAFTACGEKKDDTEKEKATEAVTEKATEAPTEEPTEEPTEAPTEEPTEAPAEDDGPEALIEYYEEQMNKMVKDKEPLSADILDSIFEYKFIQSAYQFTVSKELDSVNDYLLGIFTSDNFIQRYGDDPTEIIEPNGYTTIEWSDTKASANEKYYDMPEIEEIRKYDVEIEMSDGTSPNHWTSEEWTFAKVGGEWYMIFSDSNLT